MTATSLLLFVSLGSVDRCDTELSLSPGGVYHRRSSYSDSTASSSRAKERAAGKAPQPPEQQITMFYNGQIWVCDVTEIQARAIISSAKREMEDVEAQKQSSRRQGSSFPRPDATPSAPTRPPPPPLNRSLSVKRSLQRFLQNRKTRAVESSPYGHHRETAI
ncbi:tify domain [Musa troglodytarum]|uniref:Protein TIFY n=1 Tax=Musa troglodytarum TaxID=320322 RepID=A0A9E7JCA6_9LILI|nr:tify domain [Musa troglodytarum]